MHLLLSMCKNTVLNNRIFKIHVTSITMLQASEIWNSFVNPLIYDCACFSFA